MSSEKLFLFAFIGGCKEYCESFAAGASSTLQKFVVLKLDYLTHEIQVLYKICFRLEREAYTVP